MEHCDKFEELLEQCNHNLEEAYSITTEKVAEYRAMKSGTKEQWEEKEMWEKVNSMIAGLIADRWMVEKGYRTQCHGSNPYFKKPEEQTT